MTFKVTVKNRGEVLRALARVDQNIVRAVAAAIAGGAESVAAAARARAPKRTGALRDSIRVKGVALKDGSPAAVVGTDLFYARFVEFGTRRSQRGQVMVDGTGANWAKNKRAKRKKVKGFTLRVAARSHPGSSAKPFLFPAYREKKKAIVKNIGAAVAGAARR